MYRARLEGELRPFRSAYAQDVSLFWGWPGGIGGCSVVEGGDS